MPLYIHMAGCNFILYKYTAQYICTVHKMFLALLVTNWGMKIINPVSADLNSS